MKHLLIILATIPLLLSCEREIDIDLNSSNPQIVIEGSITDQAGPYYVKISRSVNFSDRNDFPAVTGALVIISDNEGTADTLTEISAGLYQTHTIVGIPGRTYHLSVSAEQKNYFATSRMPSKVVLDSLQFDLWSAPTGSDTYVVLPIFTDPSAAGNNYRYILTVNGELDKTYYVDNDIIGNGVVNQLPILSRDTEIELGDSVKVEMRCIDLSTYTYFYTLFQNSRGQTTPSNPPNNITGSKALGIFSAYTVQSMTEKVE